MKRRSTTQICLQRSASFWTLWLHMALFGLQGPSRKTIGKAEWEKKLADVELRKEDLNSIVMNFFVTEVQHRAWALSGLGPSWTHSIHFGSVCLDTRGQ